MRLRGAAVLAIVTVLLAGMAGNVLAQGPGGPATAEIRLKSVTFNPGNGELPNIPARLTRALPAVGQKGYYIVQFSGPVEQAWKDRLANAGVELLDYIPDNAFKVRMTPTQARVISRLSSIAWVGAFEPAYAISPEVVDGPQLLRVTVERGGDPAAVAALAAQVGATVMNGDGNNLLIGADRAQLETLAQGLDVAWIEPYQIFEKHNTSAGGIIGVTGSGGTSGGARARGYDGSTQIAAVADTGIGGGTAATAHRDIPSSRVVAIYNWPGVTDSCFQTIYDDGAVDVDSGHGTHVAGSVLSGGDPAGFGTGMAPAARLVMQSTENYVVTSNLCKTLYGYQNDYYLTGLNNLSGLFQQAYTAGARVHANSWGSAAAGSYTSNSVTADQFIWNNKDMTITFSAGNEGIDANSDGIIDNDSIGAPATAKNVITIGASENVGDAGGNFPCDTGLTYQSRDAYQPSTTCSGMSGNNILGTYGTRWPADYPANPIAGDLSAGNAEQMAAFSSRGPTDDNRIKPDVVAPGTWILSTYSDMYQEGYDAGTNPRNSTYQMDGWGMPRNGYYKYFGGTSMSNPIAAGGAVVVRDFYQKAYSLNASSALVKATLINTAVDLADENNDGVNDNDYPIPNVHEGWGRINIDNATDSSEKFFDVTSGLSTGGSKTYDVTLGGGPLKVTLVWSDYPAAANASVTLVNNLNLTLTAPNGTTTYLGNVFSGGWSATGGSADTRNNVENVYIQNPTAGTWKITVSGANVPNGPQPFALVVGGASTVVETSPPAPISTGLLSPSANAAVTSSAGDNNGFQTSPTNAYANDSAFAVDTNSGTNTNTTCTNTGKDKHAYYNYGFNIPAGVSIKGIEVRLDARADSTSGSPKMCVQLSWDGGVTWTTAKTTNTLTTSEATYTLGTATDTWGRTWSSSDFSNTSFRVRIINIASNTSRDFSLDWVAVQVTYQ